MAKAPAAWTRTPLQTLSRAPTRAPRLPADRRPAYRPKITPKKKRRTPPPRRVPPRAPDRADRTSAAAIDRFKASPRYTDALAAARLSREVQERKARLAKRPDYRPKLAHVIPLLKESPRKTFGDRAPVRGRDPMARNALRTEGKSVNELAALANMLKKAERSKNPTKVAGDYQRRASEAKQAGNPLHEPGMKLLDYAVRPTYAQAGAASALVRGKGLKEARKAASRGIKGKEKKTYGTVLREAGVPKAIAGPLGFGLDVGTDLTTYVSFGAGSVARKAAVKSALEAAKVAEEAALKAGATRAQAKLSGIERRQSAMAKAMKEAKSKRPASHHETGLQIRFAGKAVPGVERATGKVKHTARRAGERAVDRTPERARNAGRNLRVIGRKLGSETNANIRAVDPITRRAQTVSSQRAEKALRREQRAEEQAVTRDLHERINAMRGYVTKGEMRKVIDAIEANDLKPLRNAEALKRRQVRRVRTRGMHKDADRLTTAAQNIRADLKYLERVGRHSGAITGRRGAKARSLQEVRQIENQGPAQSTARTRASLAEAQQARVQARVELRNLPETAKPSERIAARRNVRRAEDRMEFLRKRLLSQQRRQIDTQSSRNVRSVGRTNRRASEARGYFPRVTHEEAKTRGTLEELSRTAEQAGEVPYARTGVDKPNIGPSRYRANPGSRTQLEADTKTEHIPAALSEDIRPTLSKYATSVARGAAASKLNTKMVQQLGTPIPANASRTQLRELAEAGFSPYRVRHGRLEKLDIDQNYGTIVRGSQRKQPLGLKVPLDPKTGKPVNPKATGGQVALLDNAQVARIRERTQPPTRVLAKTYDAGSRAWKTLALSTPGYLVRNLAGDTYNAWTDEKAWRLMRNQVRSRAVLKDLARQERAMRRFKRQIQPGQRTVKLSDEQAHEIAAHLKIPADQVSRTMKAEVIAKLAEDMGVIRQGRFVELMEDATVKPKGSNLWKDAGKRVEDQTRLATFLGGVQRGMSPREAAERASKIHFDYGDLTHYEQTVFRRIAPFYTFPARNIPHQAKSLVRRPGKFAAVAKAVEEGREATGLKEDYAEGLNPYERRQFGIPIKWGGKTYTISMGLPFTDLNDVARVGAGVASGAANLIPGVDVGGEGFTGAADAILQRTAEAASPLKTAYEIKANHSFFYRDKIEPDKEHYTRAPDWVVKLAKIDPKIRKALDLRDDYLPSDSPGAVWGWPRKTDYFFRQGQPGLINPLLDIAGLGVKGKNARSMGKAQRLLATFGLRAIEYEGDQARLTKLYDDKERVQGELDKLGRRAGADPTRRGTSSNATPEGVKLSEELSQIESELDGLQRKTRGKVGGLVDNERVGGQAEGVSGLIGGRAPLTGGRRPLTGGRKPLTGGRRPLVGGRRPLTR